MKRIINLIVILVILAALAAPALAQGGDSGELPSTAMQGLVALLAFLGTILGVGHLTNIFVDVLKDIDQRIFKIDLLDEKAELHISGYLAEIAAILIAAGLSQLTTAYLQPVAVWLDQVGLWPIIAAGWAMARQIYASRK